MHLHFLHCLHVFTAFMFMYSVHPCFQCIQSPTYVHRLRQPNDCCSMKCFHELFTCKYSCAYSSSCAHIIAHYIVVVFVKNCSTHLHEYFHHCLHVFTACMFMYSLHVFSPCKYQYICIVYDNRSTEVPLIVPMHVSMYILLIMCTNHCTL